MHIDVPKTASRIGRIVIATTIRRLKQISSHPETRFPLDENHKRSDIIMSKKPEILFVSR